MPSLPSTMPRLTQRCKCGSVLLLICALSLLMVLILFFCLQYVRLVASRHEQNTAIEAAALAVARDLSKIVIDDDWFGFVSLSDYAPTGTSTSAQDNYYLSAQSINTLLATIRLDMVVADQLNDSVMQQLALRDYQKALLAKNKLVAALNAAVAPQGYGRDINGNAVNPSEDALAAYADNTIRMTGAHSSTLVQGSLKITLGTVPGLTTNTQIPSPGKYANMTIDEQDNGQYKSYVDVPYDHHDFVFAGLSDDVSLVDVRKFESSPNLPWFIPSIVKCEADELFTQTDQPGKISRRIVHDVACAQPACLIDTRPAPGALCVSVQGPPAPEISTLQSVLYSGSFDFGPCDVLKTPKAGDDPNAPLIDLSVPVFNDSHPRLGAVMSLALYDWLRRQGYTLDVQSLLTTIASPLPSNSNGAASWYERTSTGQVAAQSMSVGNLSPPVSQDQYIAIAGLSLVGPDNTAYDIIINDNGYQSGRDAGGRHAGEPLLLPQPVPPAPVPSGILPVANASFPIGPAGGAMRPTYQRSSITTDIIFRARSN